MRFLGLSNHPVCSKTIMFGVQGYPPELAGLQLSPAGIAAAMASVRRDDHEDEEDITEESQQGHNKDAGCPMLFSDFFHLKRTKRTKLMICIVYYMEKQIREMNKVYYYILLYIYSCT